MKKHLALLLLFFCQQACLQIKEELPETVVGKFQITGNLDAEIIPVSIPVFIPRAMFIVDDKLVFYKEREETVFEVFRLPRCEHILSTGTRGQGPDDFGYIDPRSFYKVENGFCLLDVERKSLRKVRFEDNKLITVENKIAFEEYRPNNGFYPVKENLYLSFGDIGDTKEYILRDIEKMSVEKLGEYPQWTKKNVEEPFQVFVTYIKTCAIHPDREKFAAFYGLFKRWRIYDLTCKVVKDIKVNIPPFSEDIEEDPRKRMEYYSDTPYVDNEFIYVLCVNRTLDKPEESICELQIWDWEGNAIGCYRLNKRITYMAICEKDWKMYGINPSVEDEIYVYDLPEIK